jgi:hypothetical protein
MSHRFPNVNATSMLQPSLPSGMAVGGFMMCPIFIIQNLWGMQQGWHSTLYQVAFEQALAASRPSLPERDLLAVWN